MAILLVQLVTRSQRRSSAGISNTIALRKLGTRNCPCLNRFLSLKAPPLAAGIFYWHAKRFETPEAAPAALQALVTAWRSPQLAASQGIAHKHYAGKGRPTPTSPLKAM